MRTLSCTEAYLSELSFPILLFSLPLPILWFPIYPPVAVPSSTVAAPSMEVTLTPAQSRGQRSENTLGMASPWHLHDQRALLTLVQAPLVTSTPLLFSIPLASPRNILQSSHWGPLKTIKKIAWLLWGILQLIQDSLFGYFSGFREQPHQKSVLHGFHYTTKVE